MPLLSINYPRLGLLPLASCLPLLGGVRGGFLLPFAYTIASCLLPFAYTIASCLLPLAYTIAFCLLPFAFCLLPFPSCLDFTYH
ncbi:MAG: hypothetical protein F6K65_23995 [Moorea sp. SIO3C2]|nr:hypothetical protein [Moorena sp. SIO3C2]